MLVIYEPQGGERQEWTFVPQELLSLETEPLEDVGGTTWGSYDEFLERLRTGNTKARRALLWIMLRRQNPRLRFSDLVIRVDEVRLTAGREDVEYARALLQLPDLDPVQRAQLEAELEAFGDEDEPLPEPEGKDEPGDDSTDSP